MIQRYFSIETTLSAGKTLVIYGPRRTGKTTLLKDFAARTSRHFVMYNGDDVSTQELFGVPHEDKLAAAIGSANTLVIDEAQDIPDVGKSLKLINDTMPEVAVVITGSASLELAGQVGEPLVGRKITRYLYPLSVNEILQGHTTPRVQLARLIPQLLVYGSYPSAYLGTSHQEKVEFLDDLVDSQLLKDILAFKEVKGSRFLLQLLRLLAYQIGNEVSLSELANTLEVDKKTIERYLDLLEKSFIIFRVGGFSRNLRSEVTKTARYYFFDTGVRNAVIKNYNALELRDDVGKLWENFVVAERYKSRLYHHIPANAYFWRTWEQQEIDIVEERNGRLFGYEVKWKPKRTPTPPRQWTEAYGESASWLVVTPENLSDFLTE